MKSIKLNLFKKLKDFAAIIVIVALLTACDDKNEEPDRIPSVHFMMVDSLTHANLIDTAGNRYHPDTIKVFTINYEESSLLKKYSIDYGWHFRKEYLWDMTMEYFEANYDRIDTTFYLYLNQADTDTFRVIFDRVNHETLFEVYFNGKMAFSGPDSTFDYAYMFKK